MAIALGDTATVRIYRGSSEVLRVYQGAALIHESPGSTPAAFLLTEDGDRITLEDGTPLELTGTIDGLAIAVDLDGTEWAFILQDGATVKVRLSDILDYLNG
jgi:hypothetical protein